jgi:paraquat-inducible protein A
MSGTPLVLSCHHCGASFQRVQLVPGQWAQCVRCDSVLETYATFTPSAWLAVVCAAILTLALANAYPVATLVLQGAAQPASFFDAVAITWQTGYPEVALLTLAAGFVLPAVHLGLLAWILCWLVTGRLPPHFDRLLDWLERIKPWCMVPVFLMGVLVSVVKLSGLATLVPGVGLFATAVSAVLITALSRLSAFRLRTIAFDAALPVGPIHEQGPPSPAQFTRIWALLLAALILYIPANLLPIMSIDAITGSSAHTIMGGVIELVGMGSWDIALVVFIASVVVPSFKLICMATLVWLAQQKNGQALRRRTHLYGMVEFIGQWSMLDVFVVILLSALGRFGALLSIQPGAGAVAFGAVVVLTMLAAMSFDPRLAWRRAGYRKHLSVQP